MMSAVRIVIPVKTLKSSSSTFKNAIIILTYTMNRKRNRKITCSMYSTTTLITYGKTSICIINKWSSWWISGVCLCQTPSSPNIHKTSILSHIIMARKIYGRRYSLELNNSNSIQKLHLWGHKNISHKRKCQKSPINAVYKQQLPWHRSSERVNNLF